MVLKGRTQDTGRRVALHGVSLKKSTLDNITLWSILPAKYFCLQLLFLARK